MQNTVTPNPNLLPKQNLAIVPVMALEPLKLYQHRISRIHALKNDSQFAEYLKLVEKIVKSQQRISTQGQFGEQPSFIEGQAMPFSFEHSQENPYWQMMLMEIISDLLPMVSDNISVVLRKLMKEDKAQLQNYAHALRQSRFSEVPAEYSLFIWSALSLYWAHWAQVVVNSAAVQHASESVLCPVCGSHPVASVVKDSPRKGLRYLHCSLCETEWHRVRAACTNCNEADKVYLWAEEEKDALIRIESCDHCHGYTKMLFTNLDPHLDAVIDDLVNLHYDQQLTDEGFKSTCVNPFLLINEQ